jgi:hypothetical protein
MADLEERRKEFQPGTESWEDKLAVVFAEMVQMCLWYVATMHFHLGVYGVAEIDFSNWLYPLVYHYGDAAEPCAAYGRRDLPLY